MNVLNDVRKQYQSLYAFKLMQYGTVYISVISAEKLFSVSYMEKVYSESQDPPNLLNMLGIFLGFNLLLTTLIMVTLIVVSKLIGESIKTYISPEILGFIFCDYVTFVTTLVIVSVILGTLMQRKVYFRYQTEGLRVIQAYKELILVLAAILVVLPYRQLAISVLAKNGYEVKDPEPQAQPANGQPIQKKLVADEFTKVESSSNIVDSSNQIVITPTKDGVKQANDERLAELKKQLEEVKNQLKNEKSKHDLEEKEHFKKSQELNEQGKQEHMSKIEEINSANERNIAEFNQRIAELESNIQRLHQKTTECEEKAASLQAELVAAKAKPPPVPVEVVDKATYEEAARLAKEAEAREEEARKNANKKWKLATETYEKEFGTNNIMSDLMLQDSKKANYTEDQKAKIINAWTNYNTNSYIEGTNKNSKDIDTNINALTAAYKEIMELAVNLKEDAGGAARVYVKAKPGMDELNKDENQVAGNVKINYDNNEYGPYYNFFDSTMTNKQVYDSISSMMNQVKQGYHIALFGYGYSGSGKTYTLMNYDRSDNAKNGVVFQFLNELINENLSTIKLMRVFELYSKDVTFVTPDVSKLTQMTFTLGEYDKNLDSQKTTYFITQAKLDELNTTFSSDAFNKFCEDLEIERKKQKRIKVTKNNDKSSRGHLFMTFEIKTRDQIGYMTVCDMGGRENPIEILQKTEITLEGYIKVASEKGDVYYTIDGEVVKKTKEFEYVENQNTKKIELKDEKGLPTQSINLLKLFGYTQTISSFFNKAAEFEAALNTTKDVTFVGKYGKALINYFGQTGRDSVVKIIKKEKEALIRSVVHIYDTCKEGFYINESINHLMYYFKKLNSIPYPKNEKCTIDSYFINTSLNTIIDILNGSIKDKSGKPINCLPMYYDPASNEDKVGIISVLNDIKKGDKQNKFAMFACVRPDSQQQPAYKEFNKKTLEFAQSISSSIITAATTPTSATGGKIKKEKTKKDKTKTKVIAI